MLEQTPFLKQVAYDLHSRYGEELSNLTLVFPSRRARLYFSEYLSHFISKPLWQSKSTSIDELFSKISGLTLANSYNLITILYQTYKNNRPTEESFDHFYFWGETMLADFDSIDKYMVKTERLLQNLKALKNIDGSLSFLSEEQKELIKSFWKSFSLENSQIQENFVSLWNVLLPIYKDFKEILRTKNIAYQGMMYREGAEMLKENGYNIGDERFIFIGFNALNECEKILFKYLKREQKAEFYWDYDAYYLSNPQQEAGLFMRQNLRDFPPSNFNKDYSPFVESKDIQIISASSDAIQTKLIPQLLNEVRGDKELNELDRNTAVVLADEGLLIPALYSIPHNVEVLNVTMGYPLMQTPAYSLTELLIRLQKNVRLQEEKPAKFYHKDVIAILNHQYIKMLAKDDATLLHETIVNQNHVYISVDDIKKIKDISNPLIKNIFTYIASPFDFMEQLSSIFLLIANTEVEQNTADSVLRSEYIASAYRELNKLSNVLKENGMELGMKVFLSLLRTTLKGVKIPFEGEPIAGLQIMGILETRTLDFENLIILSLNEDIFPRSETNPSLIPYNLRKAFNMPTIEQHEAMYAYYFYRLLQRAKRIRLLYNGQASDTRTGEMSRFLRQLKMESPHNVQEKNVSYSVTYVKEEPIIVHKTEAVMDILSQYLEGGNYALSASALNSYLACPLQFYFAQVAKLREPEEITEEVDGAMLGNIFHQTMQSLYTPFLNQVVDEESLKQILGNIGELDKLVSEVAAKEFFKSKERAEEVQYNGKLLIAKNTVLKYVIGTLNYDLKRTPFAITGLEKKLSFTLPATINGKNVGVNIKGIIDRIDSGMHGTVIVDYKTGGGSEEKSKFNSIDSLFGSYKERRGEVLQTLLYSLIINKLDKIETIIPALYFVRNIYSTNFASNLKIKEGKNYEEVTNSVDLLPRFTELLLSKLAEIFDSSYPFVQTDEIENCTYCPYSEICHK
jgi:CRISPR/Cas system-associated exonuclease Cas4 (RecB family)